MDDVTAGRLIRLTDLTREIKSLCADESMRHHLNHTEPVLKWRFEEILTDAEEIEKRLLRAVHYLLEAHLDANE